jgi:hypothetical protein
MLNAEPNTTSDILRCFGGSHCGGECYGQIHRRTRLHDSCPLRLRHALETARRGTLMHVATVPEKRWRCGPPARTPKSFRTARPPRKTDEWELLNPPDFLAAPLNFIRVFIQAFESKANFA